MQFTHKIMVTQDDIYTFTHTFKKDAKLFNYWRQIVQNVPENLRVELCSKPTKLEKSFSDSTLYRFVTTGASGELQNYLGMFDVVLLVQAEAVKPRLN